MAKEKFFGADVPKLGFGLMRLPRKKDESFDLPQIKKMVDLFLEAGQTYFDTAWAYVGSEEAAKKALVERYPRERFTLASKLNAWNARAKQQKDVRDELEQSLKAAGVDFFDYYLLHALQTDNYQHYEDSGLWDFVAAAKREGKAKYVGFSFHAGPGLLDEILTKHPEADFVQLQINYADWDHMKIQSRANYEVARKHGKSVVVMEPVKGGLLANPPAAVQALLRAADPNASFASWAIRFAASLDGIITVLSGMSDLAQMEDNLSYMRDFKPLSKEEQKVIRQVQAELAKAAGIPCTGCGYCMEGCPVNIGIPKIFDARNEILMWNNEKRARGSFEFATMINAKPSACIACGQCESACPQQIPIIEKLRECAAYFE